jgi:ABC-type antimicrobial peptide transport system permease subunit
VAGLTLSILASRALAGQLQGMGTADPLLFIAVPGVLIIASLVACLLPARSATHIHPMEALRHD